MSYHIQYKSLNSFFQRKSAGTLVPLLIGAALLAACGVWENHTHNPYAVFPHRIMRNWRGFTIVTGVTFLVGILYYSSLILFPLQVQALYTQDPITIGFYSMALGFGGMIGGSLTGFVMDRTNISKWLWVFFCLELTAVSGAAAIVGQFLILLRHKLLGRC
jgi:MFS family permease